MCTSHLDAASGPFTCAGYSELSDWAAIELFSEQGVVRTTGSEIAQRGRDRPQPLPYAGTRTR
jgi:hypothetical protein